PSTLSDDLRRLIGVFFQRSLQLVKILDFLTVHCQDFVSGTKSGCFCSAARIHPSDFKRKTDYDKLFKCLLGIEGVDEAPWNINFKDFAIAVDGIVAAFAQQRLRTGQRRKTLVRFPVNIEDLVACPQTDFFSIFVGYDPVFYDLLSGK